MKEEINFSLKQLRKAQDKLKEVLAMAENEIVRDAAIQRFEFTYELLWKTLKIVLMEKEKLELRFPRDVFKAAFKAGLIDNDDVTVKMMEDRNLTSHVYNEKVVQTIFVRIKSLYAPCIEHILVKLK